MQILKSLSTPPYVPSPMRAGTNLGIVNVARYADAFLFSGTQLGKADGYASLRNAIYALQHLTAGAKPAGFVTEDKGKFFTHELDTAANTAAPKRGYDLGHSWLNERAIRILPGVLAVVDGTLLVRNDSSNTQISARNLWLRRAFG